MSGRVRARIDIAAPVDEVFAFFDDVGNARLLLPRLMKVTLVEPQPGGGRRVEYTVRNNSGDAVIASSEHIEYDPPHRTVARGVQSGVSTTATRDFDEIEGGTRVTATVEWEVPVRYVARLITLPLRGPFRRSLRESLAAAKEALESKGRFSDG